MIKTQKLRHAWIAKAAALVLGASLAIPCIGADPGRSFMGQKCVTKVGSRSGGCSGAPVGQPPNQYCAGSVTETQLDGCTRCDKGNDGENPDQCYVYDTSKTCKKRSRTIACVIGPNGTCIEGPAGLWTDYTDTNEMDCQLNP